MSIPRNLKSTRQINTDLILFCAERDSNGTVAYCGTSDGNVYSVDLAAEKPEMQAFPETAHDSYVTGLVGSAGGLISAAYDGRLVWWDAAARTATRTVTAHESWIRGLVASPDGRMVCSVADDMQVCLWDAESGQRVSQFSDHEPLTPNGYPSMLYAATFSPDGRLLATGDKVGHVAIWEVESARKVGELDAPVMYTWDPRQRRHSIGGIRSLAFSPDGTQLAVGGIGTVGNIDHLGGPSRVEVFTWANGERRLELSDEQYKGLVESLVFSPEGTWLVAAGGDHAGFITIFNAETGEVAGQQKADRHIHQILLNAERGEILSAHHGRLQSWQFEV